MPTTVQDVYNQVAKIFFEDLGFSAGTGMITDDMFFTALGDVLEDFLDRTECVKKIVNIPIQVGVSTYVEPDIVPDVQSASQNETFIFRDSGFYMDSADPFWNSESGQPARWREDENLPHRIQLTPIPDVDGWTVATSGSNGFGTINGTSAVVDFDITLASGAGYGTISDASTGPIYLETLNPGYGTIATMVSSTGNLSLIASATPAEISFNVLDYLELIPDSFVPYVVYGVVSKLFSADSEAKDIKRAEYARSRWQEGLQLVGAIMTETAFEEGEQP